MLAALGRTAYRGRWPLLGAWLVLILAGVLLGGRVFDRLGTAETLPPGAESQLAQRRVDQLLPEGPIVIAVIRDRDPYDEPLVESVIRVAAELRSLPGVAEVGDLYSAPGGQIGADNRSSLVRVELARGLADGERERTEDRVAALLRRIDAPQVLIGGETLAERAFADQAIRDAAIGESVALGVLLVALAVILGGPLAGAIPLVAALGAVAVSLLGLLGLAAVTRVSEFTVNVVTLLGIGLAVDYALLLIGRFREERAAEPGAGPAELLARTVASAGRAVLVSGLAVAAAMAGLAAFSSPLLATMALGGAVVVAVATAAGLTAVPALIAVAHQRIPAPGTRPWRRTRPETPPALAERLPTPAANRPSHLPARLARATSRLARATSRLARVPDRPARVGAAGPLAGAAGSGLLGRLAVLAQRRPGRVASVSAAGLVLLAWPFVFGVNLADSDARALPESSQARQVHDVLLRDFAAGRAEPVVVVVEADPASPAVRDVMNRLAGLPQVLAMRSRPDVPGAAAVLDLIPNGQTAGPESRELVRAVRDLDAPMRLLVGGPAAELVDYRSSMASRLPAAVLVLLLAGGVLLFALTGSVVIPVKALLLNALSLLATLGALVVVFQWGVGSALLGVHSRGAIDATTPVLLLVFVSGLSMDYEVFLLARIHQEWSHRSAPRTPAARVAASDRAVLVGISRTGPVITAAACCIAIVFLGFLFGELTAVKEIGFGLVVAVLLDVTVVRGLLLPAVMSLLGERNWWAPPPLRRLHDRLFPVSVPPPQPGPARVVVPPQPAAGAPTAADTRPASSAETTADAPRATGNGAPPAAAAAGPPPAAADGPPSSAGGPARRR